MHGLTRPKLAALALVLIAVSVVAAEPTTQPDVNAQLQSVRSLLDQVKEQEKALAQQEQRLEQVQQEQAGMADSLADAERRSKLLDKENISAGFVSGRGFFLASDDGNFLLHPWLQFQFRDATAYREQISRGVYDTQNGFEVRRLKFGADGNLHVPIRGRSPYGQCGP
jgi:hypothetical protein